MQPSIDMYGVTTDSKDYGIGSAPANDMASYSDQCSIAGGKAFVRNKVKYEECILKVKEISWLVGSNFWPKRPHTPR